MRSRIGALAAAIAILACIVAPTGASAMADPPPASSPAVAEIKYLLAAVGASGCEFFRNGTWHDAHQAQAHLSEKYQWLRGRDRIRTAEDFIELAATRSSLSGQAYAVRCAGLEPVSSNDWLTEQLHRYRDAAGTPRT
jgi:Family of unknown function (DUF5329)